MDDPELEKIRQQRLAQLQAQHGVRMTQVKVRLSFGSLFLE